MTVPVDNDSVTHGDTFTWDAENRLTSATVDSATTGFAYNGDGLRDSLTYDSNTTTFTWDVNASVPQVLDDGNFRYVYGLGLISEVDNSDNTYYYLSDGLGSTAALTDDSGALENTYEYDAFGAIRDSSGSQDNGFTFTGEQTDASTGLEYLRARYYDPQTGRFMSRDPLAAIPFWPEHAYTYVGSNPANLVDPYGLCLLCQSGLRRLAKEAGHAFQNAGPAFQAAANLGLDCVISGQEGCALRITNLGITSFGKAAGLTNLGYVDLNLSGCFGLCLTGGLQASFGQGGHFYGGGGIGTPQGGLSLTAGPGQSITQGAACGLQYSAGYLLGITSQSGVGGLQNGMNSGTPFWEAGVSAGVSPSPFNVAATCYYLF